jgi:hypothetical protein
MGGGGEKEEEEVEEEKLFSNANWNSSRSQ